MPTIHEMLFQWRRTFSQVDQVFDDFLGIKLLAVELLGYEQS